MKTGVRVIRLRHRLALSLVLIGLLAAVQIVQTKTSSIRASDPIATDVAIVRADNDPTTYQEVEAMVRDAVAKAGGLSQVIHPGDSVVVKPNLVAAAFTNGTGATTNRFVTCAVVKLAFEAGAGSVVIAEGTAESLNGGGGREVTKEAFMNIGHYVPSILDPHPAFVDKMTGVPLVDLNNVGETYPDYPGYSGPYNTNYVSQFTLTNGLMRSTYWLSKVLKNCDVLITVPTLKNHNGAGVTCALKNAIGYAPSDIYHKSGVPILKENLAHYGGDDGNAKTIVDLNLCRKPDFVVVDGLVGVMNGPTGYGNPLRIPNPKMRLIMAGKDPVAIDTVASLLEGYTYNSVKYLNLAKQNGLGNGNPASITVKGVHVAEARYDFDMWGPSTRAERTSPTMGALRPATGTLVSGTIDVGPVTAVDSGGTMAASGLLKAELYVDGQLSPAAVAYPVWDGAKGSYVFTPRWDSRTVPDGSHELKVFIYDAMLNEASSKVTVTVNNGSLWTALRSLSAGTPVRMGAVTATTSSTDIPGKFYVEQPDRRAGICVVAAGAPSFAEGSSLAISGSIASLSTGERVISADGVSVIGPAQKIKPFAMGNRALGGTASGSAPGPHGGTGPHNVGLLVTTWGKVIHSETGLFYVDDGSGLQDG